MLMTLRRALAPTSSNIAAFVLFPWDSKRLFARLRAGRGDGLSQATTLRSRPATRECRHPSGGNGERLVFRHPESSVVMMASRSI